MHKNGYSTRRSKISSSGRGKGVEGEAKGRRKGNKARKTEKPRKREERAKKSRWRVGEGWRGRFSLSARYNK